MTAIAYFPTKKAFKEFVENGGNPQIQDPSFFDPFDGDLKTYVTKLEASGKTPTFTNHPKRSWFANVTHKNGLLKVS